MCGFLSQFYNVVHKFVIMWLLSVIIFELVLCATHDVHRIVFKSHQRKNRDRDYYRYQPSYRQVRKPLLHTATEDEWPSETMKTVHQYYNYRPNYKNESYNIHKREKFSNLSTAKSSPLTNVELTTIYSTKIPIPITEIIYTNNYYSSHNNFPQLQNSTRLKQQRPHFTGKVRELREQNTTRNISNGYEVYEEIIEDVSPPSSQNIFLNLVKKIPVLNVTIIPIIEKDEENHIKTNTSDYSLDNIKTSEKITQSRKNRGNARFQ